LKIHKGLKTVFLSKAIGILYSERALSWMVSYVNLISTSAMETSLNLPKTRAMHYKSLNNLGYKPIFELKGG